jgi:class 3 adenylate cyclase
MTQQVMEAIWAEHIRHERARHAAPRRSLPTRVRPSCGKTGDHAGASAHLNTGIMMLREIGMTHAQIETPSAERRQLTVMFCDLVAFTPLSQRLDPEELREVVRAHQEACSEVIRHFDGHVAQFLGDGLLVYFGWPQAHEDDAQRAVRAGLRLLDATAALSGGLPQVEPDTRLAVRVGSR